MFLKSKLFLVLFSLLLSGLSPIVYSNNTGACYKIFISTQEEIEQKVLSNKFLFVKNYAGQEGYLQFTKSLQNKASMQYVFKSVHKLLNKKQKTDLGWQQFSGQASDYNALREKILDDKGEVRVEYRGTEGYALFSGKEFSGDMLKAYKSVSAVLNKKERQSFDWQHFSGHVKNYRALRRKLLDDKGKVKAEYLGTEGYALFAEREFSGDMQKAYMSLSALLGKKERQSLGWQHFPGKVKTYRSLREKLLDDKGEVKLKYIGTNNYALFAGKEFSGDMQKTYVSVSAVLSKKEMQSLEWQHFPGHVKDYRALRGKILDNKGEAKIEYIGMKGYALFAEKEFSGDMQKIYVSVSALLDKKEMQSLDWQYFPGQVKDYRALREKLLDDKGEVRIEYIGMKNYVLFAEKEFSGDMHKAYMSMSALLGKKETQNLGWQHFPGKVKAYHVLREKLLNDKGEVKAEYLGMEGHALFAEREFSGAMQQSYLNVSAVLSKKEMQNLDWHQFPGHVKDYRALKDKLLDDKGEMKTEYLGMEGYALFAEREFSGDMLKAYVNVSAVLNKKEMQSLDWHQFPGHVKDYHALKDKLLDDKGEVKLKYIGMEGYALFAKKEFSGDMQKAYVSVSALLGGAKKTRDLGLYWKVFEGTVSQFNSLTH